MCIHVDADMSAGLLKDVTNDETKGNKLDKEDERTKSFYENTGEVI